MTAKDVGLGSDIRIVQDASLQDWLRRPDWGLESSQRARSKLRAPSVEVDDLADGFRIVRPGGRVIGGSPGRIERTPHTVSSGPIEVGLIPYLNIGKTNVFGQFRPRSLECLREERSLGDGLGFVERPKIDTPLKRCSSRKVA